jgi:hypothetical protein
MSQSNVQTVKKTTGRPRASVRATKKVHCKETMGEMNEDNIQPARKHASVLSKSSSEPWHKHVECVSLLVKVKFAEILGLAVVCLVCSPERLRLCRSQPFLHARPPLDFVGCVCGVQLPCSLFCCGHWRRLPLCTHSQHPNVSPSCVVQNCPTQVPRLSKRSSDLQIMNCKCFWQIPFAEAAPPGIANKQRHECCVLWKK